MIACFQPTCSTAKLPSKYQTGGPGLFYKRYRRPQSCKYDTYRTRARRSQVDETLFGDPLSKQLMGRSKVTKFDQGRHSARIVRLNCHNFLKRDIMLSSFRCNCAKLQSMEAISSGEDSRPPLWPAQPTRRGSQRPKTALATLQSSGVGRDPEFSSPEIVSPASLGRPAPAPRPASIVLSSMEFRQIREAARAMSAAERASLTDARPPSADRKSQSPWAVRRSLPLPDAVAGSPAEEPAASPRDGAFLERAKQLREENIQEVRKLNELILSAKCNAVLDSQVAEKERKVAELAETQRSVEEMMEEDRRKADAMTAARESSIAKFYKNYKNQLQKQLDETAAGKLLQRERKEREAALRRKAEEAAAEEDRRMKEQKLKLKLELQEQLRNDNEELKRRKKEEEEWRAANDERVSKQPKLVIFKQSYVHKIFLEIFNCAAILQIGLCVCLSMKFAGVNNMVFKVCE